MLAITGCSATRAGRKYSKEEAAKNLEHFEKTGLVIGEFPIDGANAVIDGDTIRVKGLQSTLRLVCIDTEETFKHDFERKAYASQTFDQYVKGLRGTSPRPVKMATPNGDAAKHWAQGFFEGVTSVRLERDHPGEIRDYYGRYLAYVFVQKDGRWINYNLEAVRAGWAPYFTKYGQSRRFHEQFVEAQRTAQEAKLHIWSDDPKEQHYPDYPERLEWWNGRGAQVAAFEKEAENDPSKIVLSRWDALYTLEKMQGKEVTVLGAVSDVKLGDKGPSVVKLSRSRGSDFAVIFWDKDVFLSSGAAKAKGEFIQVKGIASKYVDKKSGYEQLQMKVSLPGQVLVPPAIQKLPNPTLVATDTAVRDAAEGADVKTTTVRAEKPAEKSDEVALPDGILGPMKKGSKKSPDEVFESDGE
ncbi:MAG: thermonuclease family protein [Myxococcaceae bacterium]